MRRARAVGVVLAAAVAGPAMAQTAGAIKGPYNLFISPCGEPFRAAAAKPYPVVAWFAGADANHDGALDRAEFRADAKRFFGVLDADHNGVVSGIEVQRYEHELVPEILVGIQESAMAAPRLILAQFNDPNYDNIPTVEGDATRVPDGQPPPVDPADMQGAAPFNLLAEPEPVASSDGDFDGRITPAEFTSAADRRFDRLDRNHDGKLTLVELPQTVQQQMAARDRKRSHG
jgi:hypothetical protein